MISRDGPAPSIDRTWIRTFTGRQFWPLAPRAKDVSILDIAHSLAINNRYTGHTRVPFSVAQHCCLVSDILPQPLKLCGLMHDGSEGYLADIATPVKIQLSEYGPAEERLMHVLAEVFEFEWPMPPEVKEADRRLLVTEQRDLMSYVHPPFAHIIPLPKRITAWGWRKSEREFLKRFNQLIANNGHTNY